MTVFTLPATAITGPYSPPAGQPGSTAIYKGSSSFVAWATGITVERGFNKINDPGQGLAFYGNDANALGQAGTDINHIVSLGDAGVATLTFTNPITNGPSYDFAVFENGHTDTFLELAFVEVSSDGVNFFQFEAVSLTPTNKQHDAFGALDTTNLHNLAGKFRVGYGTGFDLEELKDVNELLDVNNVTHVRVIDVVGYIEPADIYGDGIVDFIDFSIFAAAYGSEVGDGNWNEDCDIYREWIPVEPFGYYTPPDGLIDFWDLQAFTAKWLDENDYSSCDINGHQINDPWPTPFEQGWSGFDLDGVGVINQKRPVE